MKHFLTVIHFEGAGTTDVHDHETEESARRYCEDHIAGADEAKIYRFVTRAYKETVTRFDGGCDERPAV